MDRLLIVDGHNLLFQMFFGMPTKIVGAKGQAIHGVIGFVGAINRLAEMYNPTHLLVMFDGEKKNPRKDILDDVAESLEQMHIHGQDSKGKGK